MPIKPAYTELAQIHLRLYRYQHLAAIVGWDRNAMMPPKGNEARAAAEAELYALIHRTRFGSKQTSPRLAHRAGMYAFSTAATAIYFSPAAPPRDTHRGAPGARRFPSRAF